MKYVDKWFGIGPHSSGVTSGLVGGVDSVVDGVSDSASDLSEELLRDGRGRSGAL